MKSRLLAALLFSSLSCAAQTLSLSPERSSPYDLAVKGCGSGRQPGEALYVRWEDLRLLSTSKVRTQGEFTAGSQELTVLFIQDLWKALPIDSKADVMIATCDDGYTSVYPLSFISTYRPFLVLEIDGKGPMHWPPPGLEFDPGPYVISVSEELVPSARSFLDIEHKKPWSVSQIEFTRFDERDRGFFSGRWASLTPAAAAGRTIWINSCSCCHSGPNGSQTIGGNKSHRPFEVLEAYAKYAPGFFRRYIRDPKSIMASAKMEPHPHYTDEQLDELIAFVTTGLK
jgi:cytochrome c2